MISNIRKNLTTGVRGVLIAIFTFSIIYGYSSRINGEKSFLLHFLSIITDHYYVIFLTLPLFFLMNFFITEDDGDIIIMRYKTYFDYFIKKWLANGAISCIYFITACLGIAISGVGLSLDGNWQINPGSISYELFSKLAMYFDSPGFALISSALYMLVGFCISNLILQWMAHFLNRRFSIIIIALLYLLSVLSIKSEIMGRIVFISFNHLMIFHHNLVSVSRLPTTLLITIILLGIILFTIKKYWYKQIAYSKYKYVFSAKGITPYHFRKLLNRKYILILICAIFLLLMWKFLQLNQARIFTIDEWILQVFAGHGTGYFHITSFLEMLLINLTPIYLFAVFLENIMSEHSIFITIRMDKKRNLLFGLIKTGVLFVFVYSILLLFMIIIFGAIISIYKDSNFTIHTLKIVFTALSIRFLDLINQLLFVVLTYYLSKRITVGFIGLLSLNLLCIFPIKYLPFGASVFARISFKDLSTVTEMPTLSLAGAIILLSICGLSMFAYLVGIGYKRLPNG